MVYDIALLTSTGMSRIKNSLAAGWGMNIGQLVGLFMILISWCINSNNYVSRYLQLIAFIAIVKRGL